MSEETISLLGDAGNTGGIDIDINMTTEEGQTHDDSINDRERVAEMDEEPEPEPPSKEEVKQRRTLMRRITRYKAVFPQEVSELASELEGLIHKSPEELATLLEEVQFLVETRRSTAQARNLFLAGLTMGEAAGPFVGLKLQGLTQVASQSDAILTNIDECALKYEGAAMQVDPVARLAMAIGQLCLAVDGANRAREAGAVAAQPPTPEQTNIKRQDYSDL